MLAFLSTLGEHSSPVESLPPQKEELDGDYFVRLKKNALGLISYYYRYRMQRKFKNRKQMMTYSAAALTLLFSLPSYESQQCLTPAITI